MGFIVFNQEGNIMYKLCTYIQTIQIHKLGNLYPSTYTLCWKNKYNIIIQNITLPRLRFYRRNRSINVFERRTVNIR